MAKTFVTNNVKIGGIYECDFGQFKNKNPNENDTTTDANSADITDLNYRIPHELIKKRPVIVIGKHRGLCTVIPISTTKETHKKSCKIPENQGLHVKITSSDFPNNAYKYDNNKEMWAKCNLITHIDAGRLRDFRDKQNTSCHIPAFVISQDLLNKIRTGVILSIGLKQLIDDFENLKRENNSLSKELENLKQEKLRQNDSL
jgi:uncharacterized protein YifN (PemK superfamily)